MSQDLVFSTQLAIPLYDVATFGQVFTPESVVQAMLGLRRNNGRVLEPACGDGAFLKRLPGAVGVEIDPSHCPPGARNQDFFAYPDSERFDTIIGNPPYVRYQDIPASTVKRLRPGLFDGRSNLYLFFIEKCVRHLNPGGELIFITPRDFLKATSAVKLNRWLFEQGSITDAIELGDARVFDDAVPNCLIWRFEKGCQDRTVRYAEIGASGTGRNASTGQSDSVRLEGGSAGRILQALASPAWETRHLVESAGHLMFARGDYPLHLSEIAFVKVGAVSGADEIYVDLLQGNRDFVCSSTVSTGQTRRMIWCEPGNPAPHALLAHRERLIGRRIRPFDDSNWWQWGRGYHQSDRPRVYVNGKTRVAAPFFVHDCLHYDGAVLAIFPHDPAVDVQRLRDALNEVDWSDLGFVCDGRFLFTQRSLENAPLPASFGAFLPT